MGHRLGRCSNQKPLEEKQAEPRLGCDFGTRARRGFLSASRLTFATGNEMKKDGPDALAFVFGLAALVLAAKGLLATFWQNVPIFGIVWFAGAAVFAGLCAWMSIRFLRQKRKSKANQAVVGTSLRADPHR
jgi:hypothetical protein